MRTGSYARHEREAFLTAGARVGLSDDVMRIILRHARTLARLAEAQCNGDWPADNGQRRVEPCAKCGDLWAPSTLTNHAGLKAELKARYHNTMKFCQDCRTEWRLKSVLPKHWSADFAGDPRGYVVTIISPDGTRIGVA